MSQYTANGKRKSSMTRARYTYNCVCGKECRGNGGWSSHKAACQQWQEARARRKEPKEIDQPIASSRLYPHNTGEPANSTKEADVG